jgi:hypothetical protein
MIWESVVLEPQRLDFPRHRISLIGYLMMTEFYAWDIFWLKISVDGFSWVT